MNDRLICMDESFDGQTGILQNFHAGHRYDAVKTCDDIQIRKIVVVQNHDHSSTIQATASLEQGNGLFPPVIPASAGLPERPTSEAVPMSIPCSL